MFCFLLLSLTLQILMKIRFFRVNNQIITSLDILKSYNIFKLSTKNFKNKKRRSIQISKNSLIREKIKEIEIKRIIKEIKIEDKILENLIINYFKNFR